MVQDIDGMPLNDSAIIDGAPVDKGRLWWIIASSFLKFLC